MAKIELKLKKITKSVIKKKWCIKELEKQKGKFQRTIEGELLKQKSDEHQGVEGEWRKLKEAIKFYGYQMARTAKKNMDYK